MSYALDVHNSSRQHETTEFRAPFSPLTSPEKWQKKTRERSWKADGGQQMCVNLSLRSEGKVRSA